MFQVPEEFRTVVGVRYVLLKATVRKSYDDILADVDPRSKHLSFVR